MISVQLVPFMNEPLGCLFEARLFPESLYCSFCIFFGPVHTNQFFVVSTLNLKNVPQQEN